MPKKVVSKEQYEQVRATEKALGVKIALAPKGWELRVPDYVNGQYGIYQVKRCYRSGLAYIADMELIEPASSHEEALLKMMLHSQNAAEQGKLKVVVTD